MREKVEVWSLVQNYDTVISHRAYLLLVNDRGALADDGDVDRHGEAEGLLEEVDAI